jgi:hypothetical protein
MQDVIDGQKFICCRTQANLAFVFVIKHAAVIPTILGG